MSTTARTGLQLRSTVKKEGLLELSLADVPIPEPKPDEVVVRVEASPINPSDLGLLLGRADMSTAKPPHARPTGRDGRDQTRGAARDGRTHRSAHARRQRRRRRGAERGIVTRRARTARQNRGHPGWCDVRPT